MKYLALASISMQLWSALIASPQESSATICDSTGSYWIPGRQNERQFRASQMPDGTIILRCRNRRPIGCVYAHTRSPDTGLKVAKLSSCRECASKPN